MVKHLKMHNGYSGEIRLGNDSHTEFDKNGNPIHFVEADTWANIKEQLGLTKETVKGNPTYEVIGRFENVPPNFRPEYIHGDNSNEQTKYINRTSEK